ncbi:MAG: hypothetical protein Q8P13_04855 [bacterium]|nr:hypothetical protein [bacterium]
MRLKILLVILGSLLLASGIYLGINKFILQPKEKSPVASVVETKVATESAEPKPEGKKEDAKAPTGEVSGATTNTVQLPTQQNTPPLSVPDESGKIATLNSLIEKLVGLAVKIWAEDEKIKATTQGWFAALENCNSDPIIPYADCVELKNTYYSALLNISNAARKSYLADYRNYEAQANQIKASCSSVCQTIWNDYIQALQKGGIPQP